MSIELVNTREMARRLSMSRSKLSKLVNEEGCPHIRKGGDKGQLLFDPEEVIGWMKNRSQKTQQA